LIRIAKTLRGEQQLTVGDVISGRRGIGIVAEVTKQKCRKNRKHIHTSCCCQPANWESERVRANRQMTVASTLTSTLTATATATTLAPATAA